MFNFQLRPEIRKQMNNPDLFEKGMNNLYLGLVIAMSGVGGMLFLFFKNPEDVLKPTWILFFGLAIAGWGEWQKSKGK